MSIEFLRQVAATPLPKSFTHARDVDAVKILRQAGLVIAALDAPPEGGAKVIAVTDKGRAELLPSHCAERPAPLVHTTRNSWLQWASRRTRSMLRKGEQASREHR